MGLVDKKAGCHSLFLISYGWQRHKSHWCQTEQGAIISRWVGYIFSTGLSDMAVSYYMFDWHFRLYIFLFHGNNNNVPPPHILPNRLSFNLYDREYQRTVKIRLVIVKLQIHYTLARSHLELCIYLLCVLS